jgi:elongation factor Ts
MVGLSVNENSGVVVELNSETDFVARNEKFQTLMANVLKAAQDCNSLSDLENAGYPGSSQTVKEVVTEHVSIIGENISLSRFAKVSVSKGVIATYVHNAIMSNAGKIAVLVALESDIDRSILNDLGKQLAMHIAAARPDVLNREMVSEKQIAREKEIFAEQARASGKPDDIIEKMLVGRLQNSTKKLCCWSKYLLWIIKLKLLTC